MDFITIDVIKVEQQHSSEHYIITLAMTPIVKISLNKHPMSWEHINRRLIHPSDSVIKSMYHHQNLTVLQKQCPKKLNQEGFKKIIQKI